MCTYIICTRSLSGWSTSSLYGQYVADYPTPFSNYQHLYTKPCNKKALELVLLERCKSPSRTLERLQELYSK